MNCTKVLNFGHKGEPIFCGRAAVLQTMNPRPDKYCNPPHNKPHEDFACEEHASELAQLSGIEWHSKKEIQCR